VPVSVKESESLVIGHCDEEDADADDVVIEFDEKRLCKYRYVIYYTIKFCY